MPASLVFRVHPFVYNHFCELRADDACAEAKNIGIIMKLGKLC